ncbi:succinate dehydrogenase assembly factor 2 [Govanella unica]|uniref:FAD assembly factor SdhE n=1 Tax=Govanella unica TaxID=2975056 RepID=A0A9X3Z732_9PROT|nr:succinate dehydrogenase assembly factor 2 [Govania unica]MDA5193638.1 succinate dehydrogenase assembly factor 2 [Govania unica]
MTEDRPIRLKRLRFRCWHRGIKEADVLLGNFADKLMVRLTDDQLDRLEILLEEQDIDLVAWIGSIRTPPAHLDTDVMTILRKLDYLDR